LNYSAAYMMYAVVLVQEVINTYLPNLSQKKAGRMVFAGEAANEINRYLSHLGVSQFVLYVYNFWNCKKVWMWLVPHFSVSAP
jgi:hypothetical protein